MNITLVPADHLREVWPKVEPLLKKAIEHCPGRYEPIDVFVELLQGAQTLWLAFDGKNNIRAFWTLRIVEYPQSKVCIVEWLGGEDMAAWSGEALSMVKQYAAEQGCSFVESYARAGFRKNAKEDGWHERGIRFEYDLRGN